MDIDPPDHASARLENYAHQFEDGPARKRLHSEMNPPLRPFRAGPSAPTYHYSTNTPFIFSAANHLHIPPEPVQPSTTPHDVSLNFAPTAWSSKNLVFGENKFPSSSSSSGFAEDVEMREGESPARPRQHGNDGTSTRGGAEREEVVNAEGQASKGASAPTTDSSAMDKPAERKIAKGGVSRTLKGRQKTHSKKKKDGEHEGDETTHRTVGFRSDHGPTKTEHTYNVNMNSPNMRHSEIPALLLGYLQFFVNASIVVFVLYFAVQFVLTIRRDVKDKMAEASVEILQEIAECTQLYLANRCDPVQRVPAMDAPCRAWDVCMHRDPTVVGRTNVMAETFAGVINSFVDPISWKTMGFTLVTLSFLIILTNSALFNLRHRAASDPPQTPQHLYPPLQHQPWTPNHPHGFSHHMFPTASGQPLAFGADLAKSGDTLGQIGWESSKEKQRGWLWS